MSDYARVDKQDVEVQLTRITLLGRAGRPVVTAGVNAHLKEGAKGIAAAANVFDHGKPRTRIVNDHYIEPGGLGASIGSRMKKGAAQIEGKAGVGVAKSPAQFGSDVRKGSKLAVRYGHLVTIGTKDRYTGEKRAWSKRQKLHVMKPTGNPRMYRGISPPHHFVERGYESVKPDADQAAFTAMEKRLRNIAATGA